MLEILGKTSIDFMGLRRYSFAFSGVLILIGLIALAQIWRGAANLGIDFAGGTAVRSNRPGRPWAITGSRRSRSRISLKATSC